MAYRKKGTAMASLRLPSVVLCLLSCHAQVTRATPQSYIFSFPAVSGDFTQELAIATTRPHDVTINISTYSNTRSTDLGPYVIRNTSSDCVYQLAVEQDTVMSVKLTSSDIVNVYAFNFYDCCDIDAILVRDVTQLGRRYVVNTSPYNTNKAFLVVTATEDDTTVNIANPIRSGLDLSTILFAAPSVISSNNSHLTTALDTTQSISTIHGGDLTGLEILSDKPVSVSFGVNRNMMSGAYYPDHMWMQPSGVEQWGNEYATFPTPGVTRLRVEHYYIAAAEDNTQLYIDGTDSGTLPSALQWTTKQLDVDTSHYLSSDKPFFVVKAANDYNAISAFFVSLVETSRWATTLTLLVPNVNSWSSGRFPLVLTVITNETDKDTLLINEAALQVTWTSFSATGNGRTRSLVVGDHSLPSSFSTTKVVLSSVDGTARMAAYLTIGKTIVGAGFPLGGDGPQVNDDTTTSSLTTPEQQTTAAAETSTSSDDDTSTARGAATTVDLNPGPSTSSEDDTSTARGAATTMDLNPGPSTSSEDVTSTATGAATTVDLNPGPSTTRPGAPIPAQRIQRCFCAHNAVVQNAGRQEEEKAAVEAAVQQIQKNLTVAKANLSASVRKVTSAPDERQSSSTMGAVAIGSLVLVFGLIVTFDLIRVVKWLNDKHKSRAPTPER